MKRSSRTFAWVLVVGLVVAACSGPAVTADAPSPESEAVATREPPQFTPSVPEPKDARGIEACDLITDEQLVDLGLIPDSRRESSTRNTRSCGWSNATDDSNPAGLELNDNTTIPALDGLHLVRDVFANYEPLEVAGHPAVRTDYTDVGDCTIATAISDYQGVTTEGNPAPRPQPDPCALSIRMAEAILSNLPPLIEE